MLLLPTWDGDILKGKVNYFDSAYTDEVKKKKIGQSAAKHLILDEGSTTSKSWSRNTKGILSKLLGKETGDAVDITVKI